MKYRIICGLWLCIIVFLYYLFYMVTHVQNINSVWLHIHYYAVVCVALCVPTFIAGLIVGKRVLTSAISGPKKLWFVFWVLLVVCIIAYFIGYNLLIASDSSYASQIKHVDPYDSISNFFWLIIVQGLEFSFIMSLLQSLLVSIPGTIILLKLQSMLSRKTPQTS